MFNFNGSIANLIWLAVSAVVAVGGGIALFFTFLRKKNDGKFTGFWGWMYDFLTFKKMLVEDILRVCYLITAIFITLGSFALIGTNFLGFIMMLVFGNVFARISYELILVVLIICRNTTNISTKLNRLDKHFVGEETKKEAVKEEAKAE